MVVKRGFAETASCLLHCKIRQVSSKFVSAQRSATVGETWTCLQTKCEVWSNGDFCNPHQAWHGSIFYRWVFSFLPGFQKPEHHWMNCTNLLEYYCTALFKGMHAGLGMQFSQMEFCLLMHLLLDEQYHLCLHFLSPWRLCACSQIILLHEWCSFHGVPLQPLIWKLKMFS